LAEPLLHENPETKLKKAENQERRLLGKISTQSQKVADGNKRWGEASEQHCEAESRAAEYNNQLVSLRIGMAALANRVAGLQPEVAIAAGRKSHAEAVQLLAELSSAITELAILVGQGLVTPEAATKLALLLQAVGDFRNSESIQPNEFPNCEVANKEVRSKSQASQRRSAKDTPAGKPHSGPTIGSSAPSSVGAAPAAAEDVSPEQLDFTGKGVLEED
jgi:hypothetical protein